MAAKLSVRPCRFSTHVHIFWSCVARALRDAPTVFVQKSFGDIGRNRIRYESAAEALRLFHSNVATFLAGRASG